jgi:hypothetical protein
MPLVSLMQEDKDEMTPTRATKERCAKPTYDDSSAFKQIVSKPARVEGVPANVTQRKDRWRRERDKR